MTATTLHVGIVTHDEGDWEFYDGSTLGELYRRIWREYVSARLYQNDHDDEPIDKLAETGHFATAVEMWFDAVQSACGGWAQLEIATVDVPSDAMQCTIVVLYSEYDENAGPWYVFAGRSHQDALASMWRFLKPLRDWNRAIREMATSGQLTEAVDEALSSLWGCHADFEVALDPLDSAARGMTE